MPPLNAPRVPAMRLPPLRSLRIRQPNRPADNPCVGIMISMLACWASAGSGQKGCREFETALRGCMDDKTRIPPPRNDINQQLARFYPMIGGPRRRKK